MKTTALLLKSLAGTLFFLVILFVCAGRTDYWQGWLFTAINIPLVFVNTLSLRKNEELASERSTAGQGAKSWDKKILGLSALTLIATYVVAGLDAGRYQWSSGFSVYLTVLGVFMLLVGEILFLSAQLVNKFFSSVVRIQSDRGHTVCEKGVYRIVRHPAYAGMLSTTAGMPLILGSAWSFIPAVLSILLLVVRTSLEDKTLEKELAGYPAYMQKTRYRLVPFMW